MVEAVAKEPTQDRRSNFWKEGYAEICGAIPISKRGKGALSNEI
jgi:hypothetical protein